jgi:phosphopantothenoylcysteine decarboxylase/phosphopantothenate--cysteine ligase
VLRGRRIVLGVTGGIAAYKAAYLARRLVEQGAEVRTVMTDAAIEFLGPQTLAAVTGHHPVVGFFDEDAVSPHTELARWADAIVVAPATASTLSRLAHGLSEDVLAATVLAFAGRVIVAPAMHTEMWEHPATQRNVAALREDGCVIVGPATGSLAGGDEGAGRMVEPDDLVATIESVLAGSADLSGWRVLVSAGGTREPIDPVRYIGNRSSGKMGNAIAAEAAQRGAAVTLVTTVAPPAIPGIEVIRVESAAEMAAAVESAVAECDVAVLAAAVADFRPADPAATKLRRLGGVPDLDLEPTPDILAGIAAMSDRPFLVGFAAEVGSIEGAIDKARDKGTDLLVANDVARPGSGFGTDTNQVTLIHCDGSTEEWELLSKSEVARRLWTRVAELRETSR